MTSAHVRSGDCRVGVQRLPDGLLGAVRARVLQALTVGMQRMALLCKTTHSN